MLKSSGLPRRSSGNSTRSGANGRVTIQNQYGNVSITGWDRDDVLVEAVKRSADPRRLDEARIIVEPAEGALSIRTQYAGMDTLHAPKVEYRITVPRYASLEDVKLGNGGLVISGVGGAVKASSVNGSIKAEKLEGRAELSTVNGQLEADFDRIGAGRPITLSSINGPIKLLLPCGTQASLQRAQRQRRHRYRVRPSGAGERRAAVERVSRRRPADPPDECERRHLDSFGVEQPG